MSTARVYVAAPSGELTRARAAQKAVRDMGARLPFDWTKGMEELRAKHPTDATIPSKRRQSDAFQCANAVRASHVLWLLGPTRPTIGAWVELGIALERSFDSKMKILISGPAVAREATVLTDLIPPEHHFDSDAGAALFLRKMLELGTFL
jgi:hypothetical protein